MSEAIQNLKEDYKRIIGAVVVSDVLDNAVVAGNPAKVIKYKAE